MSQWRPRERISAREYNWGPWNCSAILARARVRRRLRSDLRTFRAGLDPQWTRTLRDELGWLGRELGEARDADVLLARLTARAKETSADGAREVIGALEQRRAQAHAEMLEQLRGDRYLSLLDQLIGAAQGPTLRQRTAARPAAKALRPLVRKDWRALEKKVGSLTDQPADEDLHIVRILAKRCRYAAEASIPVLGKGTRQLAGAARGLQDTLGELNDAVVAEHWLRDWAEQAPSTTGAFAASELAALERAAARQARAAWPKAWKRIKAAGHLAQLRRRDKRVRRRSRSGHDTARAAGSGARRVCTPTIEQAPA